MSTEGVASGTRPPGLLRLPDIWVGAITTAVGAVYAAAALRLENPESVVVGPGQLPAIIGFGLVVLGISLSVQAVRRHLRERAAHGETPPETLEKAVADDLDLVPEEEAVPERRVALPGITGGRRTLLTFAVFGAYVLGFIPLGFLLSTAVFLFVIMTLAEPEKWRRNAIVGPVFSASVYAAFTFGLGVYLPPGITPVPIF